MATSFLEDSDMVCTPRSSLTVSLLLVASTLLTAQTPPSKRSPKIVASHNEWDSCSSRTLRALLDRRSWMAH
jgi:hypothetical protein